MAKRVVRHLFFLIAAVMLAACGDSGGGGDSANVNSSPSAPAANAPASQPASSVTLDWNPNTEPDLAGYRIYAATSSGAYGAAIATAPANATSQVVTGLQPGVTYFFVITAFDAAGNESARSDEVSATVSL